METFLLKKGNVKSTDVVEECSSFFKSKKRKSADESNASEIECNIQNKDSLCYNHSIQDESKVTSNNDIKVELLENLQSGPSVEGCSSEVLLPGSSNKCVKDAQYEKETEDILNAIKAMETNLLKSMKEVHGDKLSKCKESSNQINLKEDISKFEKFFKPQEPRTKKVESTSHLETTNLIKAALVATKIKSEAFQFENLISFYTLIGASMGNVVNSRKTFNDILKAFVGFFRLKLNKFLNEPLKCTGLRPHYSIIADKSTTARSTNHPMILFVIDGGRRVYVPFGTPLVHESLQSDESCDDKGGSMKELALEVIETLKKFCLIGNTSLPRISGLHTDGTYINCEEFFKTIKENSGNRSSSFLNTYWDPCHILNLVTDLTKGESKASFIFKSFFRRLDKFISIYRHRKEPSEYEGITDNERTTKIENLYSLSAMALFKSSTTSPRFLSTAITCMKNVLESYEELMKGYYCFCERETEKLHCFVKGYDFVISLLFFIDVLSPISEMMLKCQSIHLNVWQPTIWMRKIISNLQNMISDLKNQKDLLALDPKLFPVFVSNANSELLDDSSDDFDENLTSRRFKNTNLVIGWLDASVFEFGNNKPIKMTFFKNRTAVSVSEREFIYKDNEDTVADILVVYNALLEGLNEKLFCMEGRNAESVESLSSQFMNLENILKLGVVGKRDEPSSNPMMNGHALENYGNESFKKFCLLVYDDLKSEDVIIDISNTDSLYGKLKVLFMETIWNLEYFDILKQWFPCITEKEPGSVLSFQVVETTSKDSLLTLEFEFTFSNLKKCKGALDEAAVIYSLYENEKVISLLGSELLTVLEMLISAGGCGAQVEEFKSEMESQTFKEFEQSNETLVNRTTVDLLYEDLDDQFEDIYQLITKLYINGSDKLGLKSHENKATYDFLHD